MPLKVLILGANGFIGSSLTRAILKQKNWEVYGMDIGSHKLEDSLGNPRFKFVEGDITINKEYIEYHVKKCDAVIPLVAIANPIQYVKDPLRVFELDFEANLAVVRYCAKYKKRIIFPSTSEVYGMSADAKLDEATTSLVYGPIERQRWIYACSKQLLDRVIYAYGVRDNVDYTLFRPFNWIGPQLDDVMEPKEGSSRLFTQFISNVIFKKPLQLVDGGKQGRSFTFIDDGVEALHDGLLVFRLRGAGADRRVRREEEQRRVFRRRTVGVAGQVGERRVARQPVRHRGGVASLDAVPEAERRRQPAERRGIARQVAFVRVLQRGDAQLRVGHARRVPRLPQCDGAGRKQQHGE